MAVTTSVPTPKAGPNLSDVGFAAGIVIMLSILFLPETAGRELHDLDALEEPVATAGPVAPAE